MSNCPKFDSDSCPAIFAKLLEKLEHLEKVTEQQNPQIDRIELQTTRTNGRVTALEHRMDAKDRVDDKQSDAIGKIRWTVAWAAGFGAAVGALASFIVKLI